MAPPAWCSLGLLTLASLQLTSAQQFVSDNLLTSAGTEESACRSRSGGYYADLASDCTSYTRCGPGGRQFGFSCPPGTRFHQQFLVCDYTANVNCPESTRYYALNELIGRTAQGSAFVNQQKRLAPAPSSLVLNKAPRPPTSRRPLFGRPAAPFSAESAPLRTPSPPQTERPAGPALPTADVGRTLLDLVRLSTRESSRRPASSRGGSQQRSRVTGSESRGRQVSPAVPSILKQVAALGRPAPRRLRQPTTSGTFFPARPERPRQPPPPGVATLERLNKSLSSPRSENEAVRPRASSRKARFPAQKTRPEAPLRSGAGRRQGLRSVGGDRRQGARSAVGGWRPVSRRAPGSDPRCPRCLAALIVDWQDCFPCVSVLR